VPGRAQPRQQTSSIDRLHVSRRNIAHQHRACAARPRATCSQEASYTGSLHLQFASSTGLAKAWIHLINFRRGTNKGPRGADPPVAPHRFIAVCHLLLHMRSMKRVRPRCHLAYVWLVGRNRALCSGRPGCFQSTSSGFKCGGQVRSTFAACVQSRQRGTTLGLTASTFHHRASPLPPYQERSMCRQTCERILRILVAADRVRTN